MKPVVPRIASTQGDAVGGSFVPEIHALGDRHEFAENFDFGFDARPAIVDDVDDFLEVEQPERQFEIDGIHDIGAVAEATAELIVSIEHEYANVRARL